jgi:hypothetical protein
LPYCLIFVVIFHSFVIAICSACCRLSEAFVP